MRRVEHDSVTSLSVGKDACVVSLKGRREDIRTNVVEHIFLGSIVCVLAPDTPEAPVEVEDLSVSEDVV